MNHLFFSKQISGIRKPSPLSDNFSLFDPFQLPSPMKLKPEKGTTGPLEKEKIAVLLLASRATVALPAQPELLWDLAQGKL